MNESGGPVGDMGSCELVVDGVAPRVLQLSIQDRDHIERGINECSVQIEQYGVKLSGIRHLNPERGDESAACNSHLRFRPKSSHA